jgi:hypothetical protein
MADLDSLRDSGVLVSVMLAQSALFNIYLLWGIRRAHQPFFFYDVKKLYLSRSFLPIDHRCRQIAVGLTVCRSLHKCPFLNVACR